MRLRKVFCALCISLLCLSRALGQDVVQTLQRAEVSFAEQHTDEALSLFHRVLFFAENDTQQYIAHVRLADIYSGKQQFSDAALHYVKAGSIAASEQEHIDLMFNAASALMKIHHYDEALMTIDTSWLYHEDSVVRWKTALFLGLNHLAIGNTEEAVARFSAFYKVLSPADSLALSNMNRCTHRGYKNPRTARTLSFILPGSGQLYAGAYKEALNSFSLNAVLIGSFVLTSLSYTWLDGSLAFMLWVPRYYVGGTTRAAQLAVTANQKRREEQYQSYVVFFRDARFGVK